MARTTLQARVGDRTYTLTRDGDALSLNGEPTDARITRLDAHAVALTMNGRTQVVGIEDDGAGGVIATVNGKRIPVQIKTEADLLLERFGMDAGESAADREVRAPMPGLVLRVLVAEGDAVEAGQGVAVLEAMKMENELTAPASGTVAAVHAAAGDAVGKNDLLVELAE
ncbi:MAG: biotin/lipoyl-containing protein [Bacteroidota bacterium]